MKRKSLIERVGESLDDLLSQLPGGNGRLHGRLLLAVSGGSDSMAMLHLIARLRAPSTLKVAFVDHGLRSGVDSEWQLVKLQCHRLKVAVQRLYIVDKYDTSQSGEGIQQWARIRRYQLLTDAAAEFDCHAILTGHTQDDQAETVLLRLLRGTGLDGLGAVPPLRNVTDAVAVVRPLLGVEREALRIWLRNQCIPWVEDPSNANERFARVQTRNLIPELAKTNPRIREHLCALSQEARDVTQWLNDTLLSDNDITPLNLMAGFRIEREVFDRVSGSLHGRLVRQALQRLAGHLLRFERVHIEDVVKGLHSPGRSRKFELPGHFVVWTAYGALYVFPTEMGDTAQVGEQNLSQQTSYTWGGQHSGMAVSVEVKCNSTEMLDWCHRELSASRIRSLKEGDRLYGSGRKAVRLLGEHRIPVMYRKYVPVLATSDGNIISIPSLLNSRVSGLLMEWHLHEVCVLNDLRQFVQN